MLPPPGSQVQGPSSTPGTQNRNKQTKKKQINAERKLCVFSVWALGPGAGGCVSLPRFGTSRSGSRSRSVVPGSGSVSYKERGDLWTETQQMPTWDSCCSQNAGRTSEPIHYPPPGGHFQFQAKCTSFQQLPLASA